MVNQLKHEHYGMPFVDPEELPPFDIDEFLVTFVFASNAAMGKAIVDCDENEEEEFEIMKDDGTSETRKQMPIRYRRFVAAVSEKYPEDPIKAENALFRFHALATVLRSTPVTEALMDPFAINIEQIYKNDILVEAAAITRLNSEAEFNIDDYLTEVERRIKRRFP